MADDDLAGLNASAAYRVVAAIRESGAADDLDEALIVGFLTCAAAVDAKPGDAGLWREYRAFAQAVKDAVSGGTDDDAQQFLISVQTPVRHPKKS